MDGEKRRKERLRELYFIRQGTEGDEHGGGGGGRTGLKATPSVPPGGIARGGTEQSAMIWHRLAPRGWNGFEGEEPLACSLKG